MKKKNVSFMTLFMLTAALIGGCSCNKQSDENVSNLVIKVGDKEYSAKQLYNDLLSTGTGSNEAFAKILRLVVESSMETSKNIQAAADLAAESFEEEVKNDSLTNGTSKDDSREKLLKEKGYSSVEEMKADIIYEQKLTRLKETYWEENKASYYNDYVSNRLPYFVRQVLVTVNKNNSSSNQNKLANNVAISQTEAEKLYDVIKRFESGDSFKYVASEESDDAASTGTGGAYYMDSSFGVNGYVDEFVYGTYAFDAYTTKSVNDGKVTYTYGANQTKLAKLAGLSDTETFSDYYENGFNFVDMSVVNILGKVYNASTSSSDKEYFSISAYEKVLDEDGNEQFNEDGSLKLNSVSNLNSSENYYARSIIFNKAFNKPGVSVIGYETEQEAIDAGAKNYVELKMSDTDSKYILTDENKNPIFFVVARGNNNALWVHFLTINVSALNDLEDAKKFFTISPNKDDSYTSYVELMNTVGTKQEENSLISEIEGYIKSYVTEGVGSQTGDESILSYDMVNHYINKNNITYLNDELKNAINSYVLNRKNYLKAKSLNKVAEDWDTHTDKLYTHMTDFVQSGIKPYECAVLIDATNTETRLNPYNVVNNSSDSLCRYIYGEGYQVQLSYYYETTSTGSTNYTFTKIDSDSTDRIYFGENSGYKKYVTIGENGSERIQLPTPSLQDGYEFFGWYTDKDLTNKVTEIDLSESRTTNNTIFFADVRAVTATSINYTYKYENGSEVDSNVQINNANVKSQTYAFGENNTITFSTSNVTSSAVTAVKFLDKDGNDLTSITLTADDYGKTIDVVVVFTPVATNLTYVYVDSEGNPIEKTVQSDNNLDTVTYDISGEENEIAINLNEFVWAQADALEAKSIKVARGTNPTFNDSENETSLTLTQEDMGTTITVYVVVGAKTTGGEQ